MTATTEGDEFVAWVNDVVMPRIGPYPAGKIMLAHKKQTTRLVKCECMTCQYPVRTTRIWIDGHGAPHCPTHGAMWCAHNLKRLPLTTNPAASARPFIFRRNI
jgi:hypothetical protein